MIIAVSNQKGGVGKTTVVVDADSQASALTWKAQRPETLPPVQAIGPAFGQPPQGGPRPRRPLRRGHHRRRRTDHPERPGSRGRRRTSSSSPPCRRPRTWAGTEEFFEAVVDVARTFKDLGAAVLLNQVQRGTRLAGQVLQYVQANQDVFDAVLHQHVAYREAFGFGMPTTEHEPSSQAAGDVRRLYHELRQKL